jgi:LuxR family maltose regulon positive regulatory protein
VIAAIAAYELHDDSHALAALAKACELASPESLRLPFALHAARVQDVLERYAPELGAQQGFALDVLDSFRSDEVGTSVEALTERERAVLRYLPMLMSNAEIAAEMFVSINTVKTHLKAVYRKLGVERRRDAVVRAKQLELV